MSYVALYRKWRPDTFDEVKGQDHIVTTLRNQIKNDRLGHAFYFAVREEQVRLRSPRYLPRHVTVSIRWTEAHVMNVQVAEPYRMDHRLCH